MEAVVLGGTGAVGREIVKQLLASEKWSKVRAIGRRPVDVAIAASDPGGKLENVQVDLDKMEEAASAFQGASTVFCALGTTRKAAGSADAFIKVDHDYVVAAAKLAKAAGVPQFSLLTAQGSNPTLWASKSPIFHALLYAKTKGLAEEAVKAEKLNRTSIFRPGLLNRGELTRGLEKAALAVMSAVHVRDVATAMVLDAEQLNTPNSGGVRYFTHSAILTAASQGTPPVAS